MDITLVKESNTKLPTMGQINTVCFLVSCTKKGHNIAYKEFLPKIFNVDPTIRKHEKSKLKEFLQNNWPGFLKQCQEEKKEKRWQNCSRLKETNMKMKCYANTKFLEHVNCMWF